ncbi:MAG: hypothetical protein HOC71_01210, partial [Candidatus Latescibacteria bacterium]|nr:hypothetical protein [Candidatus Latescibacterota bacterium]
VPSDFYPDGISQFFPTDMVDYVSGPVRLSKSDMPASSHYRHFLFLKPDALLIWDQVESSIPLEWNLWVPAQNTWAEDNVLHVETKQDIDLQVYFAGDATLDLITEQYPEKITWDWPLVMRTEYGEGMIVFLCMDLFNHADSGGNKFVTEVFQNILSQKGKPTLAGLITGNSFFRQTLTQLGIPYEILDYEKISTENLSRYSFLAVGDSTSATQDRALCEFGWKIKDYIREGGFVIVMNRSPQKWLSGGISEEGIIPVPLTVGDCAVYLKEDDFKLALHNDSVWNEPNMITPDSWQQLITGTNSFLSTDSVSGLVSSIPVSWSDSWKALASVPQTFEIEPYPDRAYRKPSRIRVRHPASRDFFTLLLPRKTGESYLFDIDRIEPDFFSFADPTTNWEIKAGVTSWTDANLSVYITNSDGRTLYAFDCMFIQIGTETIQAASPMSIYYSETQDSGYLMTADNNILTFSKGEFKLHAGEMRLSGLLSGNISIERQTFVTGLKVDDERGEPVNLARVYRDARFIGSTDENGAIPIRWTGQPPMIRVHYRGKESLTRLVPGSVVMEISTK